MVLVDLESIRFVVVEETRDHRDAQPDDARRRSDEIRPRLPRPGEQQVVVLEFRCPAQEESLELLHKCAARPEAVNLEVVAACLGWHVREAVSSEDRTTVLVALPRLWKLRVWTFAS